MRSWVFWLLSATLLMRYASSTEICMKCQSVEWQNAPGIGIDLSLGHATAAIKFLNGTIADIIKIDGTPKYMKSMKQLSDDAASLGHRQVTKIVHSSSVEQQNTNWMLAAFQSVSQFLLDLPGCKSTLSPVPGTNDIEEVDTHAIADMLTGLKAAIDQVYSLQFNRVYLSLPKFVVRSRNEYSHWFSSTATLANLSTFGGHYFYNAHAAMRELYGIYNCHSIVVDFYRSIPNETCEEYNGRKNRTVLSIDYSTNHFNLMLMPREDGLLYPNSSIVADHSELAGASALHKDNPEMYLTQLKKTIAALAHNDNQSIDFLALEGDLATEAEFLSVVDEVFRSNQNIRKQDYLKSPNDHLFASARAAAREARIGMQTDFNPCIRPRWCPEGEEELPEGFNWTWPEEDLADGLEKNEL